MDSPRCLEYPYPGAAKQVTAYPLVIYPQATYEYFEQRRGFSILSLFKNPMVLMMIVGVGMMWGMPKMMEGLDPEEKARMKKQMEAQQDPTKMFSQMFSDITGGGGEEEDPAKKRRERRANRIKRD